MLYLSIEQLLQLHALVLIKDGGIDGVRDVGRLESVVSTQTQAVFGEELYRGVHDKSAALMRGIIGDHPFSDGNKRTAMLAGLTFLEINGYVFEVKPSELEDFAVRIAVEQLQVDDIAEWLRNNSAPGY